MTREYGMGQTFTPTLDGATDAMRWFVREVDFVPDPLGATRLLNYHSLANFETHLTRAAGRDAAVALATSSS
jgi:hypothetical protein